jgi:PAS domain-containing protein
MRLLKQKYDPERITKEFHGQPRITTAGGELAAYQAVIAHLKQTERERAEQALQERGRADEQENVSEAVLNNLPSGVVIFTPMGLVRQANIAAREILGYASPSGLHARDLFAGLSQVRLDASESEEGADLLVEALQASAREMVPFRRIEADFTTPQNEALKLNMTLIPIRSVGGQSLGAACLISDLTEVARLTEQLQERERLSIAAEMSASIAEQMRIALQSISEKSRQLAAEADATQRRRISDSIAQETQAVTRSLTEFLEIVRRQANQ